MSKQNLLEFGSTLRQLRNKANLTQEALGKIAGVSKGTVYRWERVPDDESQRRVPGSEHRT